MCVACNLNNARGFPGPQCHLEIVERYRQPLTEGFDVCLLAGPAAKEGMLALVRRKGDQFSSFRRTKESLGNIQQVCQWVDLFYVNAYLACLGKAESGPTTCLRQPERPTLRLRKPRLTL